MLLKLLRSLLCLATDSCELLPLRVERVRLVQLRRLHGGLGRCHVLERSWARLLLRPARLLLLLLLLQSLLVINLLLQMRRIVLRRHGQRVLLLLQLLLLLTHVVHVVLLALLRG